MFCMNIQSVSGINPYFTSSWKELMLRIESMQNVVFSDKIYSQF